MSAHAVTVFAGSISTLIFVTSYVPMLVKAVRSRDLSSYSKSSLSLATTGNLIHSVYVFSLPPGPIWLLHTFYLLSTALMLLWYHRFRPPAPPGCDIEPPRSDEGLTAPPMSFALCPPGIGEGDAGAGDGAPVEAMMVTWTHR